MLFVMQSCAGAYFKMISALCPWFLCSSFSVLGVGWVFGVLCVGVENSHCEAVLLADLYILGLIF